MAISFDASAGENHLNSSSALSGFRTIVAQAFSEQAPARAFALRNCDNHILLVQNPSRRTKSCRRQPYKKSQKMGLFIWYSIINEVRTILTASYAF